MDSVALIRWVIGVLFFLITWGIWYSNYGSKYDKFYTDSIKVRVRPFILFVVIIVITYFILP
nr:hypothetical protein [Morganella morganii]